MIITTRYRIEKLIYVSLPIVRARNYCRKPNSWILKVVLTTIATLLVASCSSPKDNSGAGSILTKGGESAYVTFGNLTTTGMIPVDLRTNNVGSVVGVPIAGDFGDIAISPNGKTAYLTSGRGTIQTGAIVAIDLSTNAVLKTYYLPKNQSAIALASAPDGQTAYVTTGNGHNLGIIPINLATGNEGDIIDLPDLTGRTLSGGGIAISPDGKTAYVTSGPVGAGLVVVNLATRKVVNTIALPDGAEDVAVTPDGRTAVVTTARETGPSIVRVNLSTKSVDKIINLAQGQSALAVAITPDGQSTFVTASIGAGVSVLSINIARFVVGTSIGLPQGNGSFDIAIGSKNT
jgi:DNA-binding beta-propeller fold protein YncE